MSPLEARTLQQIPDLKISAQMFNALEGSIRRYILSRAVLGGRRCPAVRRKLTCCKDILRSTKPFPIHFWKQALQGLSPTAGLNTPLSAERQNVPWVGFDAYNRVSLVDDHEVELSVATCRGNLMGGAGAIRLHSVGFRVSLSNDGSVDVSGLTSGDVALSVCGETTSHSERHAGLWGVPKVLPVTVNP